MFCSKCGSENDNGVKFCRKCGAPMGSGVIMEPKNGSNTPQFTTAQNAAPNNVTAPANGQAEPTGAQVNKTGTFTDTLKKIPKMAWIGIAAVVTGIIVVVSLVGYMANTINLNKYLILEETGFEGYGKVNATIDWDAIREKYGDKVKWQDGMGGNMSLLGYDALEALSENISVTIDPNDHLSNGDEVSCAWNLNETELKKYVKVNLKWHDETYRVSNLEPISEFDPFEGISVSFSGMSPNGTATLEGNTSKYNGLNYNLEQRNGLQNGDEVTVSVNCYADDIEMYCAENLGAVPSETSKKYTVSGLEEYVTSQADIPEDVMNKLIQQTTDVFNADWAKEIGYSELESIDGFTYIGNYFLVAKDLGGYHYSGGNQIFPVFRVNLTLTSANTGEKTPVVYYFTTQYHDIIALPDGTVNVDVANYSVPYNNVQVVIDPDLSYFKRTTYYLTGYETLDALMNELVISQAGEYEYEASIDDTAMTASQVTVQTAEETADGMDGEVDMFLPDSSTKTLTEADLEGLSAKELTYARNEIYARHGYVFDAQELNDYFGTKDWYTPNPSFDGKLDPTETKNADFIRKYQDDHDLQYKPE